MTKYEHVFKVFAEQFNKLCDKLQTAYDKFYN